MKPLVQRLVNAQTTLVNKLIKEAEDFLNEEKEYDAGIKLLQAKRGAPKNNTGLSSRPRSARLIYY